MIRKCVSLLVALSVVVLLASTAMAKEGADAPKVSKFQGTISKIEANSLTVTAKGDAGEKSMTFTTNDKTEVILPAAPAADAPAKTKEGGAPATKKGTLADLKVGSKVAVGYNADNVALKIMVLPAAAPRHGKEGGR